MVLSNSAICGSRKSRFVKEKEASGLLGNLLWTKIPVLGDLDKYFILEVLIN